MAITESISIDRNLSGVEWTGTVRRVGTNKPVPNVIAMVRKTGDRRGAAISTGSQGEFRFILEADSTYELETYDPDTREERVMLQGLTASADTSFLIVLPPTIRPTRADSTIKLTIRSGSGKTVHRSARRWPPDWIEATLHNTDRDTVTLVLPGDGSFWGRRTPLMDWEIHSPGGQRLERMPVALCGNLNALRGEDILKLAPNAQRTFKISVPDYYRYEKSRRYQFRLSYENRPYLARGDLWSADPDAMRLLQQSTPCKLVSNTLELKVK